jgi:hypothetical protein
MTGHGLGTRESLVVMNSGYFRDFLRPISIGGKIVSPPRKSRKTETTLLWSCEKEIKGSYTLLNCCQTIVWALHKLPIKSFMWHGSAANHV